MTPMESWLFIAAVFVLILSATLGAGRAWDWLLDRMFAGVVTTPANVNSAHPDCPCSTDRGYHARLAHQETS